VYRNEVIIYNVYLFMLLQSLYNMLGEAHYRLKQYSEAERWYKAALQAKPDHVPAHLTYGKMLAKNVS
jgi:tetratricopeptide (TPR) repeat protein